MCIASMKNMTLAQRGKRALNMQGINCEIVNLEPMMTKKGCAFGISFSCSNLENVKKILKKKSIAYGEILGE